MTEGTRHRDWSTAPERALADQLEREVRRGEIEDPLADAERWQPEDGDSA